jgi:hypothetical protein
MTLVYRPSPEACARLPLGKAAALFVVGAAVDGRAQAVEVSPPPGLEVQDGRIPHVTVSVAPGLTASEGGELLRRARRPGGGAAAPRVRPVPALKLLHGRVGVYLTDGTVVHSHEELRRALGGAATAGGAAEEEEEDAALGEAPEEDAVEAAAEQLRAPPAAVTADAAPPPPIDLVSVFRSCMHPAVGGRAVPPPAGASPGAKARPRAGSKSPAAAPPAASLSGGCEAEPVAALPPPLEQLRPQFPGQDDFVLAAALEVGTASSFANLQVWRA